MRDDRFRESRCERASVIVRHYPSGPQAALGEWRDRVSVPSWRRSARRQKYGGGRQGRGGNACLCQSCETKPISRGQAGRSEGRQGHPCWSRWTKRCETKPIAPKQRGGQVLCEKRVMTNWTRKRSRRNKANGRVDSKWARGGKPVLAAGATHCAKRSRSAAYQPEEVPAGRAISAAAAGASAPNKANCPRAMRKASTVWRTSYGELNPQRALAKQSQFAPGRWWAGVGKAVRATGGTERAKQSQFPRAGREGESLQGCPDRRRWAKACETQPIPSERNGRASAVRRKSYDELGPQKASAKQSQLPQGDRQLRKTNPIGSDRLYKRSQ
jgi:hypothetical protein